MAAPTEGEGVGKLEKQKERIRREEKNLLIGKLMKEKANELCSEQKNVFNQCCKDAGLLMAFKCRKESKALQSCLASYYSDPEFNKQFDTEYLKKKEEFLKGVSPEKQQKSSKS